MVSVKKKFSADLRERFQRSLFKPLKFNVVLFCFPKLATMQCNLLPQEKKMKEKRLAKRVIIWKSKAVK